MSSRRRSGQPRSPVGNRSAKIVPPPVVPSAPTAEPIAIEPVAAAQDDPSVADALLSSVSVEAVDAGHEPASAAPLPFTDAAAPADDVADDPAPAYAAPIAASSYPEAPGEGSEGSETGDNGTEDDDTGHIETAGAHDADAIVVPVPPAGGPASLRPAGFASPSLASLTEINATLTAFVRGEGVAAIAHLGALTRAASPADAIRLQVGEFQRAADASLTCFSAIVRSAHRLADAARAP